MILMLSIKTSSSFFLCVLFIAVIYVLLSGMGCIKTRTVLKRPQPIMAITDCDVVN